MFLQGSLDYQLKQCHYQYGKSLKITIHLHCLIPPKWVTQQSLSYSMLKIHKKVQTLASMRNYSFQMLAYHWRNRETISFSKHNGSVTTQAWMWLTYVNMVKIANCNNDHVNRNEHPHFCWFGWSETNGKFQNFGGHSGIRFPWWIDFHDKERGKVPPPKRWGKTRNRHWKPWSPITTSRSVFLTSRLQHAGRPNISQTQSRLHHILLEISLSPGCFKIATFYITLIMKWHPSIWVRSDKILKLYNRHFREKLWC